MNYDFSSNNWEKDTENKVIKNTAIGINNKLSIANHYACADREYIYDFEAIENQKVYVGMHSSENYSLISCDLSEKKLSIHNLGSTESIPSILKSIPFDNGNNYRLRIFIIRKDRDITVKLISLIDFTVLASLNMSHDTSTRPSYGWMYDSPFVFSDMVGLSLKSVLINTYANNNGILLYIVGDSITEGDKILNPKDVWSFRIAEEIGSCVVSGRCGGGIDGVINRINSEARILKPQYVMVTIGTNGGNTDDNVRELVNLIKEIGAIPIINHVPRNTFNQSDVSANEVISKVVNELDLYSCRFDIATSLDYNTANEGDSSLFVDGIHPNLEKGTERLVSQVHIDCPFLFY